MYGRPIGGFGHGGFHGGFGHSPFLGWFLSRFCSRCITQPWVWLWRIWLSVLLGLFLLYRLPTRSLLFIQYLLRCEHEKGEGKHELYRK